MKKKFITRTLKLCTLLLAVLMFLWLAQNYLFVNYGGDKIRVEGFYKEEKNSLDVVFLGASDVFSGYSAGRAYKEFGFTSYPLSTYQNPVSLYKTQIKEILKYQSPQQIVIEVNGILYNDDMVTSEAGIRRYLDNTPFSSNKLECVYDLVCDEQPLSYVFPFVKYHSSDIGINEWLYNTRELIGFRMSDSSKLKGMYTSTEIALLGKHRDVSIDNNTEELSDLSYYYLLDFLNYLVDNEINNVVFTRFPHRIVDEESYKRYLRANEVGKIVSEYGYDYVNCEQLIDNIGLDYEKDFYDNEHMSIYGAEKLTRFWGNMLTQEYGVVPSNLTQTSETSWKEAVEYTDLLFSFAEDSIEDGEGYWLSETVEVLSMLDNYKLQENI